MARRSTSLALGLIVAMSSHVPGVAGQARWVLESRPSIVVGGVGEVGAPLFGAWAATLMPNGHLVVLNQGTDELFVLDGEGRMLRRVGREGQGPGEFMGARYLGQDGRGGLWVYDPSNIRVTHFDAGWEVTETRRVGYELADVTPASAWVSPLVNGDVPLVNGAVSMWDSHLRPEGAHLDSILVRVHDGREIREIGRFEWRRVFKVREGTSGLAPPIPFEPLTFVASGPDVLVIASSHSREVAVLDPTGRLLRTVEAEGEVRRATRDDWQRFRERFRDERSDPFSIRGIRVNRSRLADRFLDETPRGDDFPLFDEIRVDRRGNVWVREYSFEEVTDWQVISPTGELLGRLALPRGWRLLDQGPSFVVVRLEDDLGVEEVRLYGVR